MRESSLEINFHPLAHKEQDGVSSANLGRMTWGKELELR